MKTWTVFCLLACSGRAWRPRGWILTRDIRPPAGRLVDGPGARCTRTVLDCSEGGKRAYLAAHGRRAQVFLDPMLPLSSPSVACAVNGSGSPLLDTLVVFSGHDCPLWRPDNALGCYWDGTTQARSSRRRRPAVKETATTDCLASLHDS